MFSGSPEDASSIEIGSGGSTGVGVESVAGSGAEGVDAEGVGEGVEGVDVEGVEEGVGEGTDGVGVSVTSLDASGDPPVI